MTHHHAIAEFSRPRVPETASMTLVMPFLVSFAYSSSEPRSWSEPKVLRIPGIRLDNVVSEPGA